MSWLFLSGYPIQREKIPMPEIKKSPGYPEDKKSRSRSPGFQDFRDFVLGIFSRFSNPDPDPRDFEIFGIFHLGFSRDFQILIPGISGFSGFFDLAQNKKFRSRSQLCFLGLSGFFTRYFFRIFKF